MSNQSSISRFRPGFIPILTCFVCLLLLICIGPGSTQGLAAQVTLAWDANTDPAVAGYKLYYGTASRTYGTPVDVGKVTQYTLTGIQEGVNCYFAVTAYDTNRNESAFSTELECFTLVSTPGVNGAISPSNAVVVSRGMNQTFTVTPAANYAIADVLVDSVSAGPVATYSFSNVDRNHSLSASFAVVSYSHLISASAGTNGSISPSGSVSVTQGASQTFTITANTGYQIQDVKVDGASVGAVSSYTFSNVTAVHTIAASFVAKTYAIAASAGTNGSISPSGSVSVTHGASQTFTITANTGYQIQDVKVDGASVGAVSSYTFSNVTAVHTIAASFVAKTYVISASSGTNGSITPLSASVTHGASQVFTITANTGYQVQDVLVDGVSVGALTTYTFSNVTATHTIAANFACNDPVSLLELKFEEGSGSTALDSSGSGNTGTISGAVYTTDRAVGSYALSFDGSSLVTVSAKESLKPSDLSVAFWVMHASDTSTNYGGIIQGAYGGGYSSGFRVLDWHNTPLGQINFGDADPIAISGNSFVQGEWTHMVLTYDHEKIRLYQDGGLVNEIFETRNINWNVNASDLTIGLAQWYFMGMIDKVQMYNYALSSQEVGQLYLEKEADPVKTYAITATAGANGAISPLGSVSVNAGANQTFSVTPAANYKVSDVAVDGVSVGAVDSYTFSDISTNHTISASFTAINNTYTISASAGANGSINPSGSVSVTKGGSQAFTITANTGYQVQNVLVDGTSVGAVTSYTFSNVTAAHSIAASFTVISSTYTISASAGFGGSISPSGKVLVQNGGSKVFTITPKKFFTIKDVLVDGTSVGTVKSYTFSNVQANRTISATFKFSLIKQTISSPVTDAASSPVTDAASSQKTGVAPSYLLAGSGTLPGSGGWIEVLNPQGDQAALPVHIDWLEYNKRSGEMRIATGDIDGDGRDEVVVGMGGVKDAPGIAGGYFAVLDDDYSVIAWGQVEWPEYNQINGETRMACGDIDGDTIAEIVVGLGPGGEGRLEVFKLVGNQLKHAKWLQAGWPDYNRGNGETRPACGDLDGDGKEEVIVGLGTVKGNPSVPGGFFFIFDQTSVGSTDLRESGQSDASGWGMVSWPDYNRINGESWPACGDVNGDDKDEIVLGLGKEGQGRFEILGFDLLQNRALHIAWQQSLLSSGAEVHPACGRLDTDAGDKIVIGFSKGGVGIMEVFGNAAQNFLSLRQVQTQFTGSLNQESQLWPAVFKLGNQ